jgi:hypothetical protein
MAIVQALLALLTKQIGRIFNTAFGWAITLLFGQVPERRKVFLSGIGLGAVLWLVVAIGVVVPAAGAFLLAFVPLPESVNEEWVRLGMLAAAILLPLVLGAVALLVVEPDDRPRGVGAKVKAILKGYPLTIGLALTLLIMLLVAPVLKAQDVLRRWISRHIPVVIEGKDYREVVRQVQSVLRQSGLETSPERASWLLRLPTRVITFFAGGWIEDLVSEELTVFKSPKIEVLVHPSDLVVRGREHDAIRAQAELTEHLVFIPAYQTWTKEAQQLEDELSRLWRAIRDEHSIISPDDAFATLAEIERRLRETQVSFEEWEVLFRQKLLVERECLRQVAALPS